MSPPARGGVFSPETIRRLPEAARTVYVTGSADSLTTVFRWATPLIVVAFALSWLLREVPLRTSVEPVDPARAVAAMSDAPQAVASVPH